MVKTKAITGVIVGVLKNSTIIKANNEEYYGHFKSYIVDSEREIQHGLPVKFIAYSGRQDGRRPQARYIKLLVK